MLVLRDAFKRLMSAAENGVDPVTGQDQQWGIHYYVKFLPGDVKSDSFELLRRAVALEDKSPANEPAPNFEARRSLVKAAGRELAIEEHFR